MHQDWENKIKGKTILFFTAETIPSSAGGGRNAFYFARFLNVQGAVTKIAVLNYNNKLQKRQVVDNVQIIRIAYFNHSIITKFFSVFNLIYNYFKLIKTCDFIILYGRYLPVYIVILYFGKFFGKKVIFRSTLLFDDDIQTIKKRSFIFWPIYRYAFKRISLYYAINKKFEEIWKTVFSDTVPVLYIHQGVDNGVFNSSKRKQNTQSLTNLPISILSCGILIERKGYRQIFKTLSNLDIPFNYTIIGQYLPDSFHRSSNSEALEMKLLYNLGKYLLGDSVKFINKAEDPSSYYASADIFIHMANDEIPNVLLEAMAMGLPIITKKTEGLTDIARNEYNMLIYNNEDEITDLIKKLYFNREYAKNLGERAITSIENECTFYHVGEKLIQKLQLD